MEEIKMCRPVCFLAIMIFVSSCDLDSGPKSTGVTAPSSSNVPDTNAWLALIDRTTGVSFTRPDAICVNFGRKDVVNVVVEDPNNSKKPLDYQYIVTLDKLTPASEQLLLLQKAGFFTVTTGTHGNNQAIKYQLTKSGWTRTPLNSTGQTSLCFETGEWKVTKILDYNLLDSHESGLNAYNVFSEAEYIPEEWVTKEILAAFNKKTLLPRPMQATLVEGPGGFYNSSAQQKTGMLYNDVSKPAVSDITQLARNSKNFIEGLCVAIKSAEQMTDCEDKLKSEFTVHKIGIPSGGNMVVFYFTFPASKAFNGLGRGSLSLDENKSWEVDGSFSFQ